MDNCSSVWGFKLYSKPDTIHNRIIKFFLGVNKYTINIHQHQLFMEIWAGTILPRVEPVQMCAPVPDPYDCSLYQLW